MTTFLYLFRTFALFSAWLWFPGSASSSSSGISVIHSDGHVTDLIVNWNDSDFDFDGTTLYENSTIRTTRAFGSHGNPRSDYVDIGIKLTPDPKSQSAPPAVVEISIICDKDFSAIFNNDPQRIKKYWQAYFWDINTRFLTLPNSHVSFRITSIVFLKEEKYQPFIEGARKSDGSVYIPKVLDLFSKWAYKAIKELPKFDVAMAITATKSADSIWGIAYLSGACGENAASQRYLGVAVGIDQGNFDVLLGAHELGHVLGARHDADIEGCSESGFIMSNADSESQYFFSSCSDNDIGEFLDSTNAACLRNNESPKEHPILNDAAPSLQEQCEMYNANGYVPEDELEECVEVKCIWDTDEIVFRPVDNTPCSKDGNKNCFRGRCIETGFILQNMGTENCIMAGDPFSSTDQLVVSDCPKPGAYSTPLQRFSIQPTLSTACYLKTPYSLTDDNEQGDKCMCTTDDDDYGLSGDPSVSLEMCPVNAAEQWEWELILLPASNRNTEGNFVLIRHIASQNCLTIMENKVVIHTDCDENKAEFNWKLIH